jgi:hypothetical protein
MNKSEMNPNKYWWQFLLAIPPNKNEISFKRIEHLIRDKTRYAKNKTGRLHEFYNTNHETNLTASIWENFSLFDDYKWINQLTQLTENPIIEKIINCNWSYEYATTANNLCDVVINFQTKNLNGIIVIESKNLGKVLSDKDTNLSYYLSLKEFDNFDCKYLIYCIDENKKTEIKSMIKSTGENYGIISWQELAKLQIEMVDSLEINDKLRTYIKASIYNQFIDKGIQPYTDIVPYLKDEPNMDDYVEIGYKVVDMQRKIWLIPDNK